jgi:hypothetical protein
MLCAPTPPNSPTRTPPPQATTAPPASKHLAFIIGCNAYRQRPPLTHCVWDARAVADVLTSKGSDVTLCEDVDLEKFLDEFGRFMASISAGSTVVFYFSGHGCQDNGTNCLLFPGCERTGGSGLCLYLVRCIRRAASQVAAASFVLETWHCLPTLRRCCVPSGRYCSAPLRPIVKPERWRKTGLGSSSGIRDGAVGRLSK